MIPATPPELAARTIRNLQIIHIALVAGVALFLTIAWIVVRKGALDPAPSSFEKAPLTTACLSLGILLIPVAFIFPRVLLKTVRNDLKNGRLPASAGPPPTDPSQRESVALLSGIQAAFIARMAQLEGAALLATIAFMLEGKAPALIFALVVLALMAAQYPTTAALERQLEVERALFRE